MWCWLSVCMYFLCCSLSSGQILTSSQLPGEHPVCVFMKEEVQLVMHF